MVCVKQKIENVISDVDLFIQISKCCEQSFLFDIYNKKLFAIIAAFKK